MSTFRKVLVAEALRVSTSPVPDVVLPSRTPVPTSCSLAKVIASSAILAVAKVPLSILDAARFGILAVSSVPLPIALAARLGMSEACNLANRFESAIFLKPASASSYIMKSLVRCIAFSTDRESMSTFRVEPVLFNPSLIVRLGSFPLRSEVRFVTFACAMLPAR